VTLTNKHPGIFYYFFTCNDTETNTCSISKDRYARLRENLAVIKQAGLEGVILDFSPGISFNNGQVRMNYEDLRQVLAIIKEFGFTQPVPYHGIMRASVRIAALPLTEAEKKAVYLQMIRDLQQLVADNDLPEILFYPVDEADTKTGGYQEVAKYCQWIREADPRARIFISGGAAFLDQRRDLLDSCADIWYVGVLGDTGAVRNYCAGRPAGKECWFYANSTNRGNEAEYARRTFGFWFYQSPFTRQYPWAYRYYTLDPFNDTDGSWGDFVYVYPDQENNWSPNLPSLKWEGIREGIDDLRYLATLEEAIRAAPASLSAKKTEAANYLNWLKQAPEFRVFWEVGNPSKLESYNANRRRIANFIIQLLPVLPGQSSCSGQYFSKSQCTSANRDKTGGSCQLNPKLGYIDPSGPNYWKWSWCTASSVVPTSVPVVPTVTPTSLPRPTPTSAPLPNGNCSGQYFGKSQCQARTANLTGGSCQLNPKLGEIVPGGMNYWRWSWCKN